MKPFLFLPVILLLATWTVNYYKTVNSPIPEYNTYKSVINYSAPDLESGPHLIVDHVFNYNNPTVTYKITVRGEIPIQVNPLGKISCCEGTQERIVSNLSGSGIVTISGRGSLNMPGFQVERLNYNAKMRIQINGKTTCFEEPKSHCLTLYSFISLEETWLDNIEWDIITSDPENDALRYDMFKQIAPTRIPDSPHTGRTLKYQYDYPGISAFEHQSTIAGMGTFKWKYIYSSSSAEQYYREINPPNEQLNYDDDRPKPKDYPVPEGELGPPLESITWDLIDLDK